MPIPQSITDRIYYKHPNYWLFNGSGYFVVLGRTDALTIIEQRCHAAGHSGDPREQRIIIAWIAENQSIDHNYPLLPGYSVGIVPGGTRTLVPTALKPIRAAPGDSNLVENILFQLLGTDRPEQLQHLYGRLKIGDECFRQNSRMPGQVVVLAGPQHAGKTFVQEHIFTPILGGQAADPYQFVIGRNEFNGHLYRAIHLMMSNQKNPRNREDVREFFRDVASNETGLLHPKNKDAGSIKTLRRLSISCNLTEKDLAIVPPLDGLEDKVMLFKCAPVTMPLPGDGVAERETRSAAVEAQLSAFVYNLQQHKIRSDLRHPRFGVKGFLHPEIEKMVRELSKEDEFLKLIEERKQTNPNWVLNDVRAGEIYRELYSIDYLRDALRKCCGSPAAAGRLFSALADRNNGIVVVSRTSGNFVFYTITI